MLFKRTALIVLAVLFLAMPCFAEGDTNSTFIMGVGSVLAAQKQDIEDVATAFHVNVIRLFPRIPWPIGALAQYSRVQTAGEDEIKYDGRLIAFSNDPNTPKLKGDWIMFLTFGGVDLHDNDEDEGSRVTRASAAGSIGVIIPIRGRNIVIELGAKRKPSPLGKTETYLSLGAGFFGSP